MTSSFISEQEGVLKNHIKGGNNDKVWFWGTLHRPRALWREFVNSRWRVDHGGDRQPTDRPPNSEK